MSYVFIDSDENENEFASDMIHNIEELSELQKELTKWLRGGLRKEKLNKEIKDVEIALKNIKGWRNYFEL